MKISFHEREIEMVVDAVVMSHVKENDIFTFKGPLGAGKTTLIKHVFKAMGVDEVVTSPTFSYVNSYVSNYGAIYHFDLYRIEDLDSFLLAGFDEYLMYLESKVFIEWPEIIHPLLAVIKKQRRIVCYELSYDTHDLERRVLAW